MKAVRPAVPSDAASLDPRTRSQPSPQRMAQGVGLWLGLLLSSTVLAGPPAPLTDDIQLFTPQAGQLYSVPATCARDDGSYVVLWNARLDPNDTTPSSLVGRIYDASGQQVGQEFSEEFERTDDFILDGLACAADGSFLAVGRTYRDSLQEGYKSQAFDAAGNSEGPAQLLHGFDGYTRRDYSIARLGDSDYLLIWHELQHGFGHLVSPTVQALRLDALGTPQGQSFELDRETQDHQFQSFTLASNAAGEAVLAWLDITYPGGSSSYQILAQLLDPTGHPQSPPIVVRPADGSILFTAPKVSRSTDGGFVVTWDNQKFRGEELVAARSFDASGNPRTEVMPVSAWSPESTPQKPSITTEPGGEFVIAWQQTAHCSKSKRVPCGGYYSYCTVCTELFDTADGEDGSLVAQKFNSDGTSDGRLQVLTATSTEDQVSSRVSAGPEGNFLVLWQNYASLTFATRSTAARLFSIDGPPEPNQPEEPDFKVNAAFYSSQTRPTVACDADSGFVGVWQGWHEGLQKVAILARIFDATGHPTGTELTLSEPNNTLRPTVVSAPTGGFNVIWEADRANQTNTYNLFLRRFDAAGRPLGPQSKVNQRVRYFPSNSTLGIDGQGRMLAVWQSLYQDGSGAGIYGQRLDATGKRIGAEFRVNTQTKGDQQNPAVCVSDNGSAVVVWQGPDGKGPGIFAQRYNAAGLPVGKETLVNKILLGSQRSPSVACRADGAFVVLWSTETQDGNEMDLVLRRFSIKGKALGPERLVHTIRQGNQTNATVAYDPQGRFHVAWENREPGAERTRLLTRSFNAAGQPMTGEIEVTQGNSSAQVAPALCAQANGTPVVLWQDGQSQEQFLGIDPASWGIFGRVLDQN